MVYGVLCFQSWHLEISFAMLFYRSFGESSVGDLVPVRIERVRIHVLRASMGQTKFRSCHFYPFW